MLKKILIFTFAVLPIFFFSSTVAARQGCCSHHGGVCGCGCCDGSSLSATCAPYYPSCYSAPEPPLCKSQVGGSGQWTFVQNGCNQDVTITWDKGINDEAYSINISKVAGADPGPNSDTTDRSWTFSNIKPGVWYINIKAGGKNCVTSKVSYWKVEVPAVKPTLDVREEVLNEKERRLLIDSECATSITSDKPLKNLHPGFASVTIYPTEDTTYTIYAKSGKEITYKYIDVKYPLPTSTPVPTPTLTPAPSFDSKEPPAKKRGFWSWLF